MGYKSVGVAVMAAFLGASGAWGAVSVETHAFTSGLAVSASGGKTLESTAGEVSGPLMTSASYGVRGGHSATSHSPGVVYDLTATPNSSNGALLQWTSVGSDGLTGQASYVEIKIATYPITYSNYSTVDSSLTVSALSPGSVDQRIYGGLQSGKTYYVAIRVRDSSNMYGRLSANSSFAINPVKPLAPIVTGVSSNGDFTISWLPVTSDVSGDPATVANYEIFSSTALSGTVSSPIVLSSSTLSYTVSVLPSQWYFVKTLDGNGVLSDASIWLSNSEQLTRTVADDQRAVVDMAPYAQQALTSAGLTPALEDQPAYESGSTVVAYKFFLRDAANKEAAARTLDNDATLTLPLSKTGAFTVSGFTPSVAYSAYDYAVYYYNGVEDVKLGGTVDPSNGTISVVTRQTGLFKVKQVLRAQGFQITQTVPRKIFTPNGDGVNDVFNILYENPEGLDITDAKVYDLSGAQIASLKPGTYNTEASLSWDGVRSNGEKAAAGIYIYQFKAGGKYYNGTVVLAR